MKTTPALSLAASALALFALSGSVLAQQSAPAATPSARVLEHFKTADTDKDGFLSRAEAEKAMPRLATRFDAHDKDKDGKLSPSELDGMRGARGGRDTKGGHGGHGGHGGGHGGMHDQHHGGAPIAMTRSDMEAHHAQMLKDFDAADADKDGKLSDAERKVFHDKMREARSKRQAGAAK